MSTTHNDVIITTRIASLLSTQRVNFFYLNIKQKFSESSWTLLDGQFKSSFKTKECY